MFFSFSFFIQGGGSTCEATCRRKSKKGRTCGVVQSTRVDHKEQYKQSTQVNGHTTAVKGERRLHCEVFLTSFSKEKPP
jgi:hypothetical protein